MPHGSGEASIASLRPEARCLLPHNRIGNRGETAPASARICSKSRYTILRIRHEFESSVRPSPFVSAFRRGIEKGPGALINTSAQVSTDERTALAGVEKNDCSLRLDVVGKPILQLILTNGPLRKRHRRGSIVVILGDQIETAVLLVCEAMCCGKQNDLVGRPVKA